MAETHYYSKFPIVPDPFLAGREKLNIAKHEIKEEKKATGRG